MDERLKHKPDDIHGPSQTSAAIKPFPPPGRFPFKYANDNFPDTCIPSQTRNFSPPALHHGRPIDTDRAFKWAQEHNHVHRLEGQEDDIASVTRSTLFFGRRAAARGAGGQLPRSPLPDPTTKQTISPILHFGGAERVYGFAPIGNNDCVRLYDGQEGYIKSAKERTSCVLLGRGINIRGTKQEGRLGSGRIAYALDSNTKVARVCAVDGWPIHPQWPV
ncbi:hypothetical protein BJ138DRAFT_1184595 [Hygrophoropsis aurantiaca]|uniref:Uncharacterized protein n=1 Tax=Hygrophoropsis aurantiaca TaxID=72124 RepID=A0ACB7ZQ85_9AGAM|nr:hypothetical protein BJ138DRAFT_1184595 [Hygrophoropsis aurantiaca]